MYLLAEFDHLLVGALSELLLETLSSGLLESSLRKFFFDIWLSSVSRW